MADREYFNNRRAERRKVFLAILGGKCAKCGSKTDLQFDHKNPKTKKFHIANLVDSNMADAVKEINKCQLLCGKCHREKTKDKWEFALPPAKHGSLWMYKRYGCRCRKCYKAMSNYYYSKKVTPEKV